MADAARWQAAKVAGSYAWSTRDRTLEQEGFLHASRADQVEGVLARHYEGYAGRLVLLTIDTDLLTSPWREEPVGDTTYPHILGPLNPSAVVEVRELPRAVGDDGDEPSFARLLYGEMAFRMLAAVGVMVLALVGAALASAAWGEWAGLLGLVAGGVLGGLLLLVWSRRRAQS